jgi:hypothetical protein
MFATAAVIFSLLLIVTGVAKLVRPHDVEPALAVLGLPRAPFAGVFVGAAEIAIGVAAVFFVTALLAQGVLYLAFAVWVLVALRLEVPLASCGCLGRDDTPPSWGHFGLNLLAAGVSLAAALTGPMSWVWGVQGIATIVIVAVGVFLAYVVLTDGARLSGVRAR